MSIHRRAASEKFLMPQIHMEANTEQLSRLRRNMLANHYNRQIQQKQIQTQRAHSRQNPQAASRLKQPSYRDLNQMEKDYERSIKTDLARQYKYIMEQHQREKQMKREKKAMEDKKFLEGIRNLESLERLKNQHVNRQYKQNMLEHLNEEREHQRKREQQRQKQKQQFNRRYAKPQITNNNTNLTSKQKSFKDHFKNVLQQRDQIERNYLTKWSPIIRSKDQQKDRFIQGNIYKSNIHQQQRLRKQAQAEQKLKKDLRDTLAQQVRMKSLQHEHDNYQHKNEHYTSRKYQHVHHPINNPIDFRVTHDNKYILKQLQEEQQYENEINNRMSLLARNGSHALL